MTDKTRVCIPCAPFLTPCDACHYRLLIAAEDTAEPRVSIWCEHNFVLSMAEIGQHSGQRAIIQWTLRGPIGKEAAQAVVDAVREETGDVPADASKLH